MITDYDNIFKILTLNILEKRAYTSFFIKLLNNEDC